MNEPTFEVEILFGYVRLETRMVPLGDGWMDSQSRRIELDRDGRVTFVSEWESLGARIRFG